MRRNPYNPDVPDFRDEEYDPELEEAAYCDAEERAMEEYYERRYGE